MIVPVVVTLLATAVNPCVLLEARDIARVLGWSVAAGTVRAYRLPGGAGKMCTFEGRDGTVLVTVPSEGDRAAGERSHQRSRCRAHAAPRCTVWVCRRNSGAIRRSSFERGRDYGISLQPIDAQFADEMQMRKLVGALVAHLPRHR